MGGAEEEADKGQEEGEVDGRKERIGGNERQPVAKRHHKVSGSLALLL